MKKLLLQSILLVFITFNVQAQDQSTAQQTEYCILHIYGKGYYPKERGALIIYEDLSIEKRNTMPVIEHEELLKATMESINYLKDKGYVLISSSSTIGNIVFHEYVFKREN